MEDMLAGNIRSFRKQRRMTQEQLAEALGVTVGAVYKWEAKLSTPELKLIMQLADLFDVSVDALLGYRVQDNRPESIVERLYRYCQTLDPAAPAEAEKALSRYPHSLQVVYTCANIYLTYGFAQHNPAFSRRSLELLEQARILLPQSDNSEISEETILGTIADVHFQLGELEKAMEILKKHNAGGRFSHVIGSTLAAFMDRTEEAVPFLSEAMARGMICLVNAVLGYVFVYRSRGDWKSALDITRLGNTLVESLMKDGAPGFMEKTYAETRLVLAYTQAKAGFPEESRESLRKAAELAARFDSMPNYSLQSMRYMENAEHTSVFDELGVTASDSIELLLRLLDDADFSAQWRAVSAGTEQ